MAKKSKGPARKAAPKKAAPVKKVPAKKVQTKKVVQAAEPAPAPAPAAPPTPAPAVAKKCEACGGTVMDHKSDCVKVVRALPIPPPTKEQTAARETARVCKDHNNHTCIELRRVAGEGGAKTVIFLPLTDGPFSVESLGAYDFDHKYKEIDGYPVERAAKLYAGYAQHLGATDAVIEELSRLITLTEKESTMAKKPGVATATRTEKKDAAVETKKAAMKGTKPGAAKAGPKKERAPRESAADMFRTLILEGKLTDDQIFAAVKKKFNLDDKKRSYVGWYRNDLKKKGQKVPEPKGGEKAPAKGKKAA